MNSYDALLTRSCFLCNKGRDSKWVQGCFSHIKGGAMACLSVHEKCLLESCESGVLREEIKEIWGILE